MILFYLLKLSMLSFVFGAQLELSPVSPLSPTWCWTRPSKEKDMNLQQGGINWGICSSSNMYYTFN